MARGEMLPILEAARALGVTSEMLRARAESGAVPEAVEVDGVWKIPVMALVAIAKREGWTVDLALVQRQFTDAELPRYASDALAAQAAVLLAKSQATAARFESQNLFRRLRKVTEEAAADRSARMEAAETLAEAERSLEDLRKDHAVAEAKLEELRRQLRADDRQFEFLVERIEKLERERHRLTLSLGWFGRIRYRRLINQELRSPLQSAPPHEDGQQRTVPEPVDLSMPVAPSEPASAPVSSPVSAPAPSPAPQAVPAEQSAGGGNPYPPPVSLIRTQRGHFDQSALTTTRSFGPVSS